ncbi:cobalt ECF transporter T component CbiQ [Zavarzinia sp.]|uniref:cobalt ECF transporter T component CbiQ n=1 Tax=Zavarzinia sp. TaxID=2027920 RepID=UPI0035626E83
MADVAAAALTETGAIGRLDPRTRLLATLAILAAVIALHGLAGAAGALALCVLLAVVARLPFGALRHRLLHVEGFMALLLIMLPFTMPGRALFELGPLAASAEGLDRALLIALKVNAAMLAVAALLGTLEPVRLGHALRALGVPLRLVQLFLFATRYVAIFREEMKRLREAMRARAFTARSNRHTWRSFGNLAGMMLVRSLERAERVEEAMRCRGFSGRLPAIGIHAAHRGDGAFALALALPLGALLLLDRLP